VSPIEHAPDLVVGQVLVPLSHGFAFYFSLFLRRPLHHRFGHGAHGREVQVHGAALKVMHLPEVAGFGHFAFADDAEAGAWLAIRRPATQAVTLSSCRGC
jgi:hypothetical protein